MRTLLGIDVGTSGAKTVLFRDNGDVVAAHTAEYPMNQPYNGWAEQDPLDWWKAVCEGVQTVLAAGDSPLFDRLSIAGVGLSGQMHGLVLLDKDGVPLRPSIIWCDQRTEAETEDMARILGRRRIIEITANPPMTGFTAAKILWVKKHEPEIWARTAHILLPKDYIRYMLTGDFASDVSDASGMQLMDVSRRCWSSEMLDALGIDIDLLPKLYESQEITGRISSGGAKASGLAEGTPIAGGAGDNPAAAVGTGVVREGRAFTTIGSSAVIYAVSDNLCIDLQGRIHSLCASVPGKWTFMSCTQGAGLSVKWTRDNFCADAIAEAESRGIDSYDVLDEEADKIPIGSDGLLYLPYLMGERSPHPDADCRGVFFGLSAMHTRAHIFRAVREGIAFSQLECLDVFRELGVSVHDMILTGGGSHSALMRQMLADLYGCPVKTLKSDEGAALGAALLAGVGVGLFTDLDDAYETIVRPNIGNELPPSKEAGQAYAPYFNLYKNLYQSLKNDFQTLSKIATVQP
jgi:xylulokinase